jgi:hypothetical protein
MDSDDGRGQDFSFAKCVASIGLELSVSNFQLFTNRDAAAKAEGGSLKSEAKESEIRDLRFKKGTG